MANEQSHTQTTHEPGKTQIVPTHHLIPFPQDFCRLDVLDSDNGPGGRTTIRGQGDQDRLDGGEAAGRANVSKIAVDLFIFRALF